MHDASAINRAGAYSLLYYPPAYSLLICTPFIYSLPFLSLSLAIISHFPFTSPPFPLFQRLNQRLTQDNKRLEKNHRLLSIFFYFNFPLHFSRPKSFWPTLPLYSSFHFSLKTVKSSVSYLPPPPPPSLSPGHTTTRLTSPL